MSRFFANVLIVVASSFGAFSALSDDKSKEPKVKTEIRMVNGDLLTLAANLSEFSRVVEDEQGNQVGYRFKWEPKTGSFYIFTVIDSKSELATVVTFSDTAVDRVLEKHGAVKTGKDKAKDESD